METNAPATSATEATQPTPVEDPNPRVFRMGTSVKCRISPVKGLICGKKESPDGLIQWEVRDPQKSDDMGHFIDEHTLEVTGRELESLASPEDPNYNHFNFYQEVEEVGSGFRGLVTAKYTYFNGCVSYIIQGKEKKGDKLMGRRMCRDYELLLVTEKDQKKDQKEGQEENKPTVLKVPAIPSRAEGAMPGCRPMSASQLGLRRGL